MATNRGTEYPAHFERIPHHIVGYNILIRSPFMLMFHHFFHLFPSLFMNFPYFPVLKGSISCLVPSMGFASLREAMASARLAEEIGATVRTGNAAEHF
jgi:hypothetical protein